MKTRLAITVFIIFLFQGITGCHGNPATHENLVITVNESGNYSPSLLALTHESGDSTEFCILRFPEGREIYSIARENLLSVWESGLLIKTDNKVQWLDFNVDTNEYVPVNYEFSEWDTPFSVDPANRLVNVLAHAIPPTRSLFTRPMFGVGNEFNEFIAEVIEILSPLPANGWPTLWIDRPGQAGAVTPEMSTETRKLRVYAGKEYVNEFAHVSSFYFVDDGFILNDSDGWGLMEDRETYGADRRSLSFGQVEGEPRPLSRKNETILVAYDNYAESDDRVISEIYIYGIFTRDLKGIFTRESLNETFPQDTSYTVRAGDFTSNPENGPWLILMQNQDSKELELMEVRLDGEKYIAALIATIAAPGEITETFLYSIEAQ